MELIDTLAFQRLRRIKQLGAASLVFHGAESSNLHINWRILHRERFIKINWKWVNFNSNKFVLYGAALLHDLGHGPLSHTSESIFNHNHELW